MHFLPPIVQTASARSRVRGRTPASGRGSGRPNSATECSTGRRGVQVVRVVRTNTVALSDADDGNDQDATRSAVRWPRCSRVHHLVPLRAKPDGNWRTRLGARWPRSTCAASHCDLGLALIASSGHEGRACGADTAATHRVRSRSSSGAVTTISNIHLGDSVFALSGTGVPRGRQARARGNAREAGGK